MNTTISREEWNKTIEEIHSKVATTEKNGNHKCCDMCYAKAKYTFDDDDGVDSYRCGTHSRSINDRIRRVRID